MAVCIALPFVFNACDSSKRAIKKKVVLDTLTVSAKNNPIDIFRATTAKEWEIDNTALEMSFNMKEKTANGRVWLTMHPYAYATDSLVLDAKSMQIDSVCKVDNNTMQVLPFKYNDTIIRIKFNKEIKASETIGLYIKYTAMPYRDKTGGSAAINDDRGLYFINTDNAIPGKPVQIWTQGETEANSHWIPTIDKPNQRTTTRFKLTVPDTMTTLSNGYLEQQINLGNGMRTDVWIMDKPIQVYVMMFAIGKYVILKDRDAFGKPVSYYVEPEFAQYGKEMFKNTPEMIEYFSKVTGVPYPWNKYSQVVVRDYVSGAMENTSASLFGEFMNRTSRELRDANNEDVISHELFHQWFGDYVTAESWTNLTLNESFATFGEQLWLKYKYGKAAADREARATLWGYAYGSSKWSDPALVRFYYADKEDMFDGISYGKGAVILRYLQALAGEEQFSKAMQLYLTKNALHSAEATQWRLAVEEATGRDWNWFFNQWYNRGGHPVLDMKYNYDDAAQKLTVEITQTQKGGIYQLPVKVSTILGNGVVSISDLTIDKKKSTFTCSYAGQGKPVVLIDKEHWIVGETEYNFEPWQWLKVYNAGDDNIVDKILAVYACKKTIEDSTSQSVFNLTLKDAEAEVRKATLQNLEQIKQSKIQDKYKQEVMNLAAKDADNIVRANAFDVLRAWKVTDAKLVALQQVYDSSYAASGAALALLKEIAKDTAYTIAKQLIHTKPKGDLENSIWDIVASQGKNEDIVLYENKATSSYGRKKISLANGLTQYLRNVKDNKVFVQGVVMVYDLAKGEPIKSYRMSIGALLVKTADYYKQKKDNVKTYSEKNEAEVRLASLKDTIRKLMNEESDDKNKAKYKEYFDKL